MRQELQRIEVVDVGADFPMEIGIALGERVYQLRQEAIGHLSPSLVRILDRLARAWLKRNRSPYLKEIDALAGRAREPGVFLLNLSYEWGCSTAVKLAPDGNVVLQRTLDWSVAGLGRHIVAARIACPLGAWMAMTWPAYTGVIQAIAPGRFAAAINQPMPARRTGWLRLDALLAGAASWRSTAVQPGHLLRRAFETAPTFAAAREILMREPVAAPVIYTLAGIEPGEAVTIERDGRDVRVLDDALAVNEWRAGDWRGRQHPAFENERRLAAIAGAPVDWDATMAWVAWPMLNEGTRLAMLACPVTGRLMARGYEAAAPATEVLDIMVSR